MLTKISTFTNHGLQTHSVTIEVGCTRGEDKMVIVGLGDTAVKESKQRVWMALRSAGFRLPSGRTITINLAPADLRKTGPRFDLGIAIGLLIASEVITVAPEKLERAALLGELALDGSVRHVSGVLPTAIACKERGITTIIVPEEDGPEAALISGLTVIGVQNLSDLVAILAEGTPPSPVQRAKLENHQSDTLDLSHIRGQSHAKRALEIAAAGGHNLLLSGPPGAGKSLLAKALQGILPPLTEQESIDVTQIYSIANMLPAKSPLIAERPFRSVHHTASATSIVGGGNRPRPGEISLAHRGVLFLDELTEFPNHVLEVLRQPLEERSITINRASGSVAFPADFTLIAAMNPPKFAGPNAQKVQRKLSGPLLDRIDLTVNVDAVPVEDLQTSRKHTVLESPEIRTHVAHARSLQTTRLAQESADTNAAMGVREVEKYCLLSESCKRLMCQAMDSLKLSARSYHRTLKVARTIADLAGSEDIEEEHLAEAVSYRMRLEEE